MLPQPLGLLRAALREIAGASASPEAVKLARELAAKVLDQQPFRLIHLAVTKFGRTHFVVFYVEPLMPVEGATLDLLREALAAAFARAGRAVRCEVVAATASPPFPRLEPALGGWPSR
jgi:predicted Co/Zn/Cd cation transporter (cation efflux family)